MNEKKKKIVMPDTLIIVAAVVLLMAILSWVIPSGSYDYHEVDVNGTIRNVAIDGTYHEIDKSEVTTTGILGFFGSLYRGCVSAADIIFVIFCCCGTFGILVKTGAFHAGIGTVLRKLGGKEILLGSYHNAYFRNGRFSIRNGKRVLWILPSYSRSWNCAWL